VQAFLDADTLRSDTGNVIGSTTGSASRKLPGDPSQTHVLVRIDWPLANAPSFRVDGDRDPLAAETHPACDRLCPHGEERAFSRPCVERALLHVAPTSEESIRPAETSDEGGALPVAGEIRIGDTGPRYLCGAKRSPETGVRRVMRPSIVEAVEAIVKQ
jgi:hypothetical protein